MFYPLPERKQGVTRSISLGVFSSAKEAQQRFKSIFPINYSLEQSRPQGLSIAGIGDDVFCLGKMTQDHVLPGLIVLRRGNVLFTARWQGGRRSALAYAKKIDNLILQDNFTFPKGANISLPRISLTKVPAKIALNREILVKYKVGRRGARVARYEGDEKWSTSGVISMGRYSRTGKYQTELIFVTSDNVVEAKTINYQVIKPSDSPSL